MSSPATDFSHRAHKDGEVAIYRGGRHIATLRGAPARRFLADFPELSENERQKRMARLTGNYKRGNERDAKRR